MSKEMGNKKTRIPHKFLPWIDARKKFRLSHAHIQMARELGMNPKRFVSPSVPGQRPGKLSLPQYIESLYKKRFEKSVPDVVQSIEEMAAQHAARREAKKAANAANAVNRIEETEPLPFDFGDEE